MTVAAATPAITALLTAGVPHEVLRYQHDPRRQVVGAEAIEEMTRLDGVDPARVYKTLVLALPDGGLGVAILPVPRELSLKAAAAALGAPKATLADADVTEQATGFAPAAVSPFGQRRPLPTVVDASVLRWERVLCSSGQRGWIIAVHPQDLIRLTDAVIADICA